MARSYRGTSYDQRDEVVVASPMGRTMLPTPSTAGTTSAVVSTVQALVARTEDVEHCGSSRTGVPPLLGAGAVEYATTSKDDGRLVSRPEHP